MIGSLLITYSMMQDKTNVDRWAQQTTPKVNVTSKSFLILSLSTSFPIPPLQNICRLVLDLYDNMIKQGVYT